MTSGPATPEPPPGRPRRISLIVAMGRGRVIGVRGRLPWQLPADLRRFRELTWGKPVLMGRRTHASIGRPLPGRRNLVLTRSRGFEAPGCSVVHSLEEALAAAGECDELMVIGGETLYRELLPLADCLYLTEVDGDFAGDTHFPEFAASRWREVHREELAPDDKNPHGHRFRVLVRRE